MQRTIKSPKKPGTVKKSIIKRVVRKMRENAEKKKWQKIVNKSRG